MLAIKVPLLTGEPGIRQAWAGSALSRDEGSHDRLCRSCTFHQLPDKAALPSSFSNFEGTVTAYGPAVY